MLPQVNLFSGRRHRSLVGLRERMPSKSIFGRGIMLVMLGAQKTFCFTPTVRWLECGFSHWPWVRSSQKHFQLSLKIFIFLFFLLLKRGTLQQKKKKWRTFYVACVSYIVHWYRAAGWEPDDLNYLNYQFPGSVMYYKGVAPQSVVWQNDRDGGSGWSTVHCDLSDVRFIVLLLHAVKMTPGIPLTNPSGSRSVEIAPLWRGSAVWSVYSRH